MEENTVISPSPIVEWLKAQVPVTWQERYLVADTAIWTPFLSTCDGYLGKQVWISPQRPDEVVLVILWASRAQWKAIPVTELEAIEQDFIATVGRSFPLIETAEYALQDSHGIGVAGR
jgi:uncharacterized protein (TIGR03792 family)